MRTINRFNFLQVSSADNLCKQLGSRPGTTNVGPDLDPNCLTLIEKDFEKNQPMAEKLAKVPSRQS